MFFSGTAYRAVSLTKDKVVLNDALDDIVKNGWNTPNTNIRGALNKVQSSFVVDSKNKENSNRYVAILSDGIPTSDGSTEVYNDETESETLHKLYDTIGPNTKKTLENLKKDGVKIISLLAKSDDPEETSFVESIFKDKNTSDMYRIMQDGQDAIDAISNEFKDYVIGSVTVQEIPTTHTTIGGYEDEKRRKEVNANFESLYYGNTVLFDEIKNYNASDKSKENAKKLSDLAKMKVVGGQNYEIEHGSESRKEIKDENGTLIRIETTSVENYTDQNVELQQRAAISIEPSVTATGLEIILADGSFLDIQERDPGSDKLILQVMDDEIAHGATIRIEYTITVRNNSSITCNNLAIITHLPPGFIYDKNARLITENKVNSDYDFEQYSADDLLNGKFISEETYNLMKTRNSIVKIFNKAPVLKANEEKTIKCVVSRVISKVQDLEQMNKTIAEVLTYKDTQNRRMGYLDEQKKVTANSKTYNILTLRGVYAGDSKDEDCASAENKKVTNYVSILPPTGTNRSILIQEVKVVILLLIATITIIVELRKRKVVNTKN